MRLETVKEVNNLKRLNRKRDDVWDIKGNIAQAQQKAAELEKRCAEGKKVKGDVIEFCQAMNDKWKPGGELWDKDSAPNPRKDQPFIRRQQPLLIKPWWEEKTKQAKDKAQDPEDVSADASEGESGAPILKRRKK